MMAAAALITGVSALIGDGRFDDTEDMADMRIEGDLFRNGINERSSTT